MDVDRFRDMRSINQRLYRWSSDLKAAIDWVTRATARPQRSSPGQLIGIDLDPEGFWTASSRKRSTRLNDLTDGHMFEQLQTCKESATSN